MAAVRNAQLQLARDRAVLQEQELELTHLLTSAIRDMDQHYALAQTNYNRYVASKREVEAVQAAYETGASTLDLVLDAQRRRAEAERDYFRSLIDYNLAVTQVHFRKGSLLEYNGIYLAEGPWPKKAYFDAVRHARKRDASYYLDYGSSRPQVISRGPYAQHAGVEPGGMDGPLFGPEGSPTLAPPEGASDPGDVPEEEVAPPMPLPEEDMQAPQFDLDLDAPSARAAPAAGRPRFAGARKGPQAPASAGTKTRDLGDLNLRPLAVKPAVGRQGAKTGGTGVRPASFETAVPDEVPLSPSPSTHGWRRADGAPGTHHEPDANHPSAEAPGDAPGWQGLDR
jgi:hypothetical protein